MKLWTVRRYCASSDSRNCSLCARFILRTILHDETTRPGSNIIVPSSIEAEFDTFQEVMDHYDLCTKEESWTVFEVILKMLKFSNFLIPQFITIHTFFIYSYISHICGLRDPSSRRSTSLRLSFHPHLWRQAHPTHYPITSRRSLLTRPPSSLKFTYSPSHYYPEKFLSILHSVSLSIDSFWILVLYHGFIWKFNQQHCRFDRW